MAQEYQHHQRRAPAQPPPRSIEYALLEKIEENTAKTAKNTRIIVIVLLLPLVIGVVGGLLAILLFGVS